LKKQPVILDENQKREFHQTKYFPGTHGNPFDTILRTINKINDINTLIFIVFLIFATGIITLFNQNNWFLLLIFAAIDWLIISILPLLRISFGPVNSQVFLLFLLRGIFIWLPFPLNLMFEIFGVILIIIGFVYEPSVIKVSNIVLTSKKIKSSDEIKFIQIGDIHLEKPGIRETKLIEIIKKISPQFVLFTGDFLNLSNNENPDSINQIIDLFNKINQISPVYFVTGSPAVDLTLTIEAINKSIDAIHVNDRIEEILVGTTIVKIIGLYCSHNPDIDIQHLKEISITPETFNIMMYHSPDLIYDVDKNRFIDLMLSGHTHGGQVRLPFFGALFTGSLYGRKLQSGLYRLNQTYLYISRGIGLEGMGAPRVRFMCKPEVVEWVIRKQSEEL
jgi:predicted MPP superfamily phosphohydrolase